MIHDDWWLPSWSDWAQSPRVIRIQVLLCESWRIDAFTRRTPQFTWINIDSHIEVPFIHLHYCGLWDMPKRKLIVKANPAFDWESLHFNLACWFGEERKLPKVDEGPSRRHLQWHTHVLQSQSRWKGFSKGGATTESTKFKVASGLWQVSWSYLTICRQLHAHDVPSFYPRLQIVFHSVQ